MFPIFRTIGLSGVLTLKCSLPVTDMLNIIANIWTSPIVRAVMGGSVGLTIGSILLLEEGVQVPTWRKLRRLRPVLVMTASVAAFAALCLYVPPTSMPTSLMWIGVALVFGSIGALPSGKFWRPVGAFVLALLLTLGLEWFQHFAEKGGPLVETVSVLAYLCVVITLLVWAMMYLLRHSSLLGAKKHS